MKATAYMYNMRTTKMSQTSEAARSAPVSRREFVASLGKMLAAAASFGIVAQMFGSSGPDSGTNLAPGDYVCTDSGNAIEGGFVLNVDHITHDLTVIASGGYLKNPYGVVIDASGQIIVSDTSGRIIRIDPKTRTQKIVADASPKLLSPYGIALDSEGKLLVVNCRAVLKIDPLTGDIQVIASGRKLVCPIAVAVADNGYLFVADRAKHAQVVRIDPKNGDQKVLPKGPYLGVPQGIAVQGNNIYVTVVATPDGNSGNGRVVQVDARTGKQQRVSEGDWLRCPIGIAIAANGQLIVSDPDTINPGSPDIRDGGYDGAIIQVDPAARTQTVIARGRGSYVNPRGVAIVPTSLPARMAQARK